MLGGLNQGFNGGSASAGGAGHGGVQVCIYLFIIDLKQALTHFINFKLINFKN